MARGETTVGIIGCGLIGGSIAIKLRQTGFAQCFLGYDSNELNGNKAVDLGIIDEAVAPDLLISRSDIIILAIPVSHALTALPDILKNINQETIVIDFGSTKHKISQQADRYANRHQFVACHPIAGTENTGPLAAFATLFEGKVNIICDREKSSIAALEVAENLSSTLGMTTKYMGSEEHDRHIAYVSHMSHVSSFILGQTVLDVEKNEQNIFDMAGSGFESTVRLAKSSPEMWAPIFTENAENVLDVVDQYIENLKNFRSLIEEKNEDELRRIMTDANVIRKVLEK